MIYDPPERGKRAHAGVFRVEALEVASLDVAFRVPAEETHALPCQRGLAAAGTG